mgnify:CR=1 FL=1
MFIALLSVLNAFLFIFTSTHIEFNRLLTHGETLQSDFWNSWSSFIINGNMKYIGYVFLFTALIIILLTLFKKRKYDEYQVNVLGRCIMLAGLVTLLLLPIALIIILSDPNYAVATILFLLTAQWTSVLIMDIVYTVKYM